MNFLLDTNVLSEAKRKKPNRKVVKWLATQGVLSGYISVISIGEIEEGVRLLGESRKATELQQWSESLKHVFRDRILEIDTQTMLIWGQIRADAKRKGKTLAVMDALLAATALKHDLVLVSRNTSDFLASNAKLFNPWN